MVGRRHRHPRQRRHRLAVRLRPQGRPQCARRVFAHGRRRAGLGRGGGRGPGDPAHRMALARPARQPRHQRGDRLGHLGPAAGLRWECRWPPSRPRSIPPRCAAFSKGRPDVASLHDLHIWPMSTTEIALDLPSGDAAWAPRGRLHPWTGGGARRCGSRSTTPPCRSRSISISPARSPPTTWFRPGARQAQERTDLAGVLPARRPDASASGGPSVSLTSAPSATKSALRGEVRRHARPTVRPGSGAAKRTSLTR